MSTIIHPAATRGYRDMGWIKLYQSFNPNRPPAPNRSHFGVMIILDNGIIAPGGKGFGMHPHENMEIVSVVIRGAMVHSDTAGHHGVNVENSVQLISAGTGVEHSEYNHSEDTAIDNLQIWFLPRENNLKPDYQQIQSPPEARDERWQPLASPELRAGCLHIRQDVWIYRGSFSTGRILTYERKLPDNGIYLFIIAGKVTVEGHLLGQRDGVGVTHRDSIQLTVEAAADLLLIDVPMNLP